MKDHDRKGGGRESVHLSEALELGTGLTIGAGAGVAIVYVVSRVRKGRDLVNSILTMMIMRMKWIKAKRNTGY